MAVRCIALVLVLLEKGGRPTEERSVATDASAPGVVVFLYNYLLAAKW